MWFPTSKSLYTEYWMNGSIFKTTFILSVKWYVMFTPTARLLFNYYLVTVTMWQSTRNNSSFSELENIHFYFNLHKDLVYIWFHGVTIDLTQETVVKVKWLAGNVLMRRFEEQSFEWWDERWSAGVGEVGRQSWRCEGHPSEGRQHGGAGCGRAERLKIFIKEGF